MEGSICRYFANGACSKGDSCRYSHDRSKQSKDVCQFYQVGKCSFGNTCKFHHIRDKGPSTSSSTSSTKMVKPMQLVTTEKPKPKPGLNTSAPEFVPSWKKKNVINYASAVNPVDDDELEARRLASLSLCPYFETTGECTISQTCPFVHGDLCDLCNTWCLHIYSEEKIKLHRDECLMNHERAMEQAFIEQRSREKTCGICMENVFEKDLRFGILNGCKHCFCLDCIRQWRTKHTTTDLDSKVVRSCPECRQHSDYVVPSVFWVEEDVEKDLLINMYKENTKAKVCKYYTGNRSLGNCPFGNKCFYKHQLPDGSIDPGESPHVRRRPQLVDFLLSGIDDDSDENEDDLETMELLDAFVRNLRNIKMYKVELDSKKVVGKCVDAIRENTNASLCDCHQSFQSILRILEPYLGSADGFAEIQENTSNYEPDIITCFDRRMLDLICTKLYDIFLEKQELSFSSTDNDSDLINNLGAFCDIVEKTDPRIPLEILSRDNYDWLNQMTTVLQMDQDPEVRQSIIQTFHTILTRLDKKVIHALCDTQLPIVLVSMTSSSEAQSKIFGHALKVLTLLYSTDILPPLSHLDYLNTSYFSRLYSVHLVSSEDVLNLASNLYHLLKNADLSIDCLIEPFVRESYGCSQYAIFMIASLNRICTVKRLKYIQEIIRLGKDVLEILFYVTDLRVLTHILAREMINSSDDQIRKLCNSMLLSLINECQIPTDEEISQALTEYN
ncbi:unnamed protein product [Caenorhabditis angaria]|uniref:RING-type E3 ubiquitin transferase n=1 Tax=Caenorhabditis angaria TaxID=860376 RepID=A0A9P1N5C6_9PELO|nr:unnamed protein product [Caenorhabditis angaria]